MSQKPPAAPRPGADPVAADPAAAAAILRPGDLEHALDQLARVFEDEEWPPGEARFRRNRLIERLRGGKSPPPAPRR